MKNYAARTVQTLRTPHLEVGRAENGQDPQNLAGVGHMFTSVAEELSSERAARPNQSAIKEKVLILRILNDKVQVLPNTCEVQGKTRVKSLLPYTAILKSHKLS
jgi:hypothetical protein